MLRGEFHLAFGDGAKTLLISVSRITFFKLFIGFGLLQNHSQEIPLKKFKCLLRVTKSPTGTIKDTSFT
jgi:hypothetical protein